MHSPSQNHLLAALTAPEQERLFQQLELVPMPLGKLLFAPPPLANRLQAGAPS